MRRVGPTNGPAPTRRWRNDASTPAFARSALSCSTSVRTAAGCQKALISATSAQVLTATGGCSGLVRPAQSDQKSDQHRPRPSARLEVIHAQH